jgi:hypothetical protein
VLAGTASRRILAKNREARLRLNREGDEGTSRIARFSNRPDVTGSTNQRRTLAKEKASSSSIHCNLESGGNVTMESCEQWEKAIRRITVTQTGKMPLKKSLEESNSLQM